MITFLDTMALKAKDGTTNAHRYLHFQNAHPHKIKRNIPFTLAQRITGIVSNENHCEQHLSELTHFVKGVTSQKI